MAKRTTTTTRRNPATAPVTTPDASKSEGMEQRVLAFAEQLGRVVGTVQAKTEGLMDVAALKEELARVRDGAANLLQQLAERTPTVAEKPAVIVAAPRKSRGRSGGVVDAPGKRHRPLMASDPDATRARSQTAKLREAKTMVKTDRRRGRG